jgi:PKD repeat protein
MNITFTRLIYSISFLLAMLATSFTNGQCHASFASAQVSNTLTIEFSDASTSPANVITSWLWEFGDGTSSADQNPHHTFTHDGTFHVCLTIHDNIGCSNQLCQDVIVNAVTSNCHTSFTSSQVTNTLTVAFTDASTSAGTITSWLWNFGDGTTSSDQNPHHTFTHDGTFHVCLVTHDNQGCASDVCLDIIVTGVAASCHSSFTFGQISNTLTIEFADASTTANTITSWLWEFGDGTSSADHNPHHIYTHDGTYHVCLTIHDNQGCSNQSCQDVVVSGVSASCHALFTTSPTNNPLEIHFSDGSSSAGTITSWLWNFGDGHTSTNQNTGHAYTHGGTYHVCLTIHDNLGCSSEYCHDVIITAPATQCHAAFTFVADSTNLVQFTNTSTGTTTSTTYEWTFGDGTSSADQNTSHTYSHADHYTVCLFINDPVTGCHEHYCQTINSNHRQGHDHHALVPLHSFVNDAGVTINLSSEQYIINYPNPFRTSAAIQYELTEDANVQVDIFDRNGRKMLKVLNEHQSEGQHTQAIHAGTLSPGLYILKMNVGGESFQKKIVIVR